MVIAIRNLACTIIASLALTACLDDGQENDDTDSTPSSELNSAPQIAGTPPATAEVGKPYEFVPEASDADGDVLTFRIANRPSWATFSATTGRLSGTPPADAAERYDDIRVTVTDGSATDTLPQFDLTIEGATGPNSAPTISGAPATSATIGNSYEFVPRASDADGDPLVFSVTNKPGWLQFESMTGRLHGTPTAGDVGVHANIVVAVSDGLESTALVAFSIDVNAGAPDPVDNTPPTISGVPPLTIATGQSYQFQPTANDTDGQALTFSISGKPGWATFSTSTGRLSGTPSIAQVGQYGGIVITVGDGIDSTALATFTITVIAANNPPQISGTPAASVKAGESYAFVPAASDPDGQTLTFSISGKPSWATFNNGTGRLSGTPGDAHVGQYANIVITASDGAAQAMLGPFGIEVLASNSAPVLGGTPPLTGTAGELYDFRPSARDPDGDTLTFSISNRPSWATFSTTTGRLYGTPTTNDVGNHPAITISVSDRELSDSLASFTITVGEAAIGSATLRWAAPTQNEDGSPLTNLQGYRVYYGQNSSNLASLVDVPDPDITSATIEELAPATWYFAVKAYTTDGTESTFSNRASKTID